MKKLFDKIRLYLFNKKCPNVKCGACEYFYYDSNRRRRCLLFDKYFH